MKRSLFLLLVCISLLSCSSSKKKVNTSASNEKISVLFVGNSLTYSNDLPKLVEKKAKRKGINVETAMMAFPNYGLIDHWNDGLVQKELSSKKYNFVILQQGPSSQTEGREMLIEYGREYSVLCKNNNAKLCYFMVWPSLKYYHTFEGVIKNHRDAASINNALLIPVGASWKEHFDSTNNFDYYSPDGFHPSLNGSQKAADVIVEYLFQKGKE